MFYKKYIAGIVSFAGVAMNNVKADNGKLTITIDDEKYIMNENIFETKNVNNVITLLEVLENNKKNIKKDESEFKGKINKFIYFVKNVKEGNNDKIGKDYKITLNANTEGNIELVSKKNRIKIEYDKNCLKRLKSLLEGAILKLLVQGLKLSDLAFLKNIVSEISTLGDVPITSDNVIGTDIKLFEKDGIVKFVVKDVKAGKFKTVVFDIPEDIEKKLLTGVKLDNIYNKPLDDIKKLNNGKAVLDELNKIKIDDTNDSFFKGNFEILKGDDVNVKTTSVNNSNNINIIDATFIVLKGIKAENINHIFLKKKFKVELSSDDNKKALIKSAKDEIEGALNKALSDKVVKASDIKAELKKLNTIFENGKFNDYTNLEIDSTDKSGAISDDHIVNKENVLIKIKEVAFKKEQIAEEITLTFNTNNISKDGRNIKTELTNKINNFIASIKGPMNKEGFATRFNEDVAIKKSGNQQLVKEDFDFCATVEASSELITKSGEIKLKSTVIANLDDSCFEPKKDEEEEDNNQDQNGGSDKNEGDNKNKRKCSGSGKKNKQNS